MGEREILTLLQKHDDYVSAKDLTDELKENYGSIRHCLKQMRKYKIVIHKIISIKGRGVFMYAHPQVVQKEESIQEGIEQW